MQVTSGFQRVQIDTRVVFVGEGSSSYPITTVVLVGEGPCHICVCCVRLCSCVWIACVHFASVLCKRKSQRAYIPSAQVHRRRGRGHLFDLLLGWNRGGGRVHLFDLLLGENRGGAGKRVVVGILRVSHHLAVVSE